MTALDLARARQFVSAVPRGRWTSYKDVATAAGNPSGAQAVGQWLRRHGTEIENVYRVLTIDGHVADGFVPAGPGIPEDEVQVRRRLRDEGVHIDADGMAAGRQRFRAGDWSG